jgi:hypothetical protein
VVFEPIHLDSHQHDCVGVILFVVRSWLGVCALHRSEAGAPSFVLCLRGILALTKPPHIGRQASLDEASLLRVRVAGLPAYRRSK